MKIISGSQYFLDLFTNSTNCTNISYPIKLCRWQNWPLAQWCKDSVNNAHSASTVESEVELWVEPEIESEVEPDVEPEVESKVEPKVEPEAEPEAEPEVEPDVEPEVEPEVKPEAIKHGALK